MGRITEPDFNTELARLLRKKHPEWSREDCIRAENTNLIEGQPSAKPDILVCHSGGVPVVLETEFSPATNVEKDAINRLGKNLVKSNFQIEQSIALKVPERLRETDQAKIMEEIEKTEFEYCVFSLHKEELEYPHRWPDRGWISGNVDDLADMIELTALSENILNLGMNILENKISTAATTLRKNCEKKKDILIKIADSLHQEDDEQTTCMAMAIVLNAIMFHISLTGHFGVKSKAEIWTEDEVEYSPFELIKHWEYIIKHVNYLPIFSIALKVLRPIDDINGRIILKILFDAANQLGKLGTTARHDLCGRMFQRLITDRKFLATYYTLPSSAALLAEMAIARLNVDWSNENDIKTLKVADFACGTGALLNASMHSVISRHNRAEGSGNKIHKHLIEDVLVGADIMPAATHLTASMIAGAFPENKFENTSIFTLSYGEVTEETSLRDVSIGSLELLGSMPVFPIFNTGEKRLTAKIGSETKTDISQRVPDHSCDIVIMNPPYARPCGQESDRIGIPAPCFKGMDTSEAEQRLMKKRLDKLVSKEMVGHGNAGLGSYFFDIAHKKVKSNGVVALVLPLTFIGGESWRKMRQCLESNYTDIVIFSIVCGEKFDRAFSSDTGMAEILIVATRKSNNGKIPTKYVNLRNRPQSIAEAVTIAKKLVSNPTDNRISLGQNVVAEISTSEFSVGVKYDTTAAAASGITQGKLVLPYLSQPIPIPTTPLGSLAETGLYHLSFINTAKTKDGKFVGPFDKISPPTSNSPTFPMLWQHNAKAERKLVVNFDSEGKIRKNCEENANKLWNETKSLLHFSRDFRLNSQPLAACITPMETIGGHAWPNVKLNNPDWIYPILLWANTTLGIISFWGKGTRQQLGRSRITIKVLLELFVLDARKLSDKQLKQAEEIFETIKDEEFLPANEAYHDPTRKLLDRMVLVELLGVDKRVIDENLNKLREQWCEEPTVHGYRLTRPKSAGGT